MCDLKLNLANTELSSPSHQLDPPAGPGPGLGDLCHSRLRGSEAVRESMLQLSLPPSPHCLPGQAGIDSGCCLGAPAPSLPLPPRTGHRLSNMCLSPFTPLTGLHRSKMQTVNPDIHRSLSLPPPCPHLEPLSFLWQPHQPPATSQGHSCPGVPCRLSLPLPPFLAMSGSVICRSPSQCHSLSHGPLLIVPEFSVTSFNQWTRDLALSCTRGSAPTPGRRVCVSLMHAAWAGPFPLHLPLCW